MATLYELTNQWVAVIDGGLVVDEETGEILFDSENIDQLEAALNDKMENVALYVKNLEAEADMIRLEEKALADRRRRKENSAKRLREYLLNCISATDTRKLETPKVALSLRRSKTVEVLDEAELYRELPDAFTEQAPKLDKTVLRRMLQADGDGIKNARFVEHDNLQLK